MGDLEVQPISTDPAAALGGRSMFGSRFWESLRSYWPLILPLGLYLPWLGYFPFPSATSAYSDLVVTHLPYLLFLKTSLLEYHSIPLWTPGIFSGAPFAANPLAGIWYPPGWLPLLFPAPAGFNLSALLHVLWLGVGMVGLLRALGIDKKGALLGALAIQFLPKLVAHYGAGHLTLLYAFAWTPWLFYTEVRRQKLSFEHKPFLGPGLVLSLIFLADVRWAVYGAAVWILWAIHLALPLVFHSFERFDGMTRIRRVKPLLNGMMFQLGLFLALTAPLSLALIEFTGLSTRANLKPSEAFIYSLPPVRLLGFGFPDFGGNQEWILYSGGCVLLLAFLGVIWTSVRRRFGFWGWVALVTVLLALGDHLIPGEVLRVIPGIDLLRVPPRSLFLTGFALAVLSAGSVNQISAGLSLGETKKAGLLLAGVASFCLVLSLGIRFLTGSWVPNFVWGAVIILVSSGLIWAGIRRHLNLKTWYTGLILLCLLDWSMLNRTLISPRAPQVVWEEGRALAEYLAEKGGAFRVYSPSYSLPQHHGALAQLQQADGVDPLHLESYARYMESATGIPRVGYSVTLPPFETARPEIDNEAYRPRPDLLGQLNVGYVISSFDLAPAGLELETVIEGTRIYRNELSLPRAWLIPAGSEELDTFSQVHILLWEPNQILIRATGPGTLVLSEIHYPGWVATVNGDPASIEVKEKLFRSIRLGPGDHLIGFHFRPWRIYLGILLSFVVLVLCSWRGFRQIGYRGMKFDRPNNKA